MTSKLPIRKRFQKAMSAQFDKKSKEIDVKNEKNFTTTVNNIDQSKIDQHSDIISEQDFMDQLILRQQPDDNNSTIITIRKDERPTKELKKYSGNFRAKRFTSLERPNNKRDDGDAGDDEETINDRKTIRVILKEKDEQILKLVDRLTSLHSLNAQSTKDIERYQNEIKKLQLECNDRKKASACDLCELLKSTEISLKTDNEVLTEENHQLNNDIKMLKILIHRLNVQLERHQEIILKYRQKQQSNGNDENLMNFLIKTPSPIPPPQMGKDSVTVAGAAAANNDGDDDDDDEEQINLAQRNWNTNKIHHALSPLLNAYEQTINEKSQLIQQYENEWVTFTGRLKLCLDENEQLHNVMKEMKHENDLWITEKTRLQAQYDVCRSKAEIQSKRADLAKEKLIEVLRRYEQKLQVQNIDMERLQEAYGRCKGELTIMKNVPQQSHELLADSLKECQKLFEELKLQYDLEKQKLTQELDTIKSQLNVTNDKSTKLIDECNQLKLLTKRQKECYQILIEKNSLLRQNLARVRESREIFKNRLKHSTKGRQNERKFVQQNVKDDNNNEPASKKLEEYLHQKDNQMHLMNVQYLSEIDKLSRKLKQREDTLRKILQNKIIKTTTTTKTK